MKAISRYFAMCAVALTGMTVASCTSDLVENSAASSRLVIDYTASAVSTETRADQTENGSDDLNENKITRLDLFAFNSDGTLLGHQEIANPSQTAGTDGYNHHELTNSKVSQSAITGEGNQVYLVANCSSVANITSLSALQSAVIGQSTSFNPYQKQTTFVMDATKPSTSKDDNGTFHVKFDLKRALSKIRLSVKDANGSVVATNKIGCQLIHYAADASVIDGGTCSDNKMNTDKAATNSVKTPSCTQDSKAVFYSYANEWLDENKSAKNEEPINADKQTYILLKAPFNNKDYYYKVPVNRRLPENSDQQNLTISDYKSYYSLERNYIYDITATVDRQGGSDPDNAATLYVEPKVADWNEGGSYSLSDAITVETEIEQEGGQTGNSANVKYQKAKYGPKITFKNLNTNGKRWNLQVSNPYFGFVLASKVSENGTYNLDDVQTILTGDGSLTTVGPFYVVPRTEYDNANPIDYTCNVYMTAGNDRVKVLINSGMKLAGNDATVMTFTQVQD